MVGWTTGDETVDARQVTKRSGELKPQSLEMAKRRLWYCLQDVVSSCAKAVIQLRCPKQLFLGPDYTSP